METEDGQTNNEHDLWGLSFPGSMLKFQGLVLGAPLLM